MNQIVLIFSSVTFAMKAQRALKQYGIASQVRRTSNGGMRGGCSFSLLPASGERDQILEILGRNNVPVQRIQERGEQR